MINVVTGPVGFPAAVLIRSVDGMWNSLHALTKWLWGRVLGHHIREAAQSWSIHSKDNL